MDSSTCSERSNGKFNHIKRRRREEMFCHHCNRVLSKSTFYRHCREKTALNQTGALTVSPEPSVDIDSIDGIENETVSNPVSNDGTYILHIINFSHSAATLCPLLLL